MHIPFLMQKLSKVYLVVEQRLRMVMLLWLRKEAVFDQCVWLCRCWKTTLSLDIRWLHINQQCKRLYFQGSLISWLREGCLNMESTRKQEWRPRSLSWACSCLLHLTIPDICNCCPLLFFWEGKRERVSPHCKHREWW